MSQKQQILEMLEAAGDQGVTGNEFYAAFLPRFAARIKELRDQGHNITTERIDGNHFVYTLHAGERERRSASGVPSNSDPLKSVRGVEPSIVSGDSSPACPDSTETCGMNERPDGVRDASSGSHLRCDRSKVEDTSVAVMSGASLPGAEGTVGASAPAAPRLFDVPDVADYKDAA